MAFVKVGRLGKVTVVSRDGWLYLVYTSNGKQRISTGYRIEGNKIPSAVIARADEINSAFVAAAAQKTLRRLGVTDDRQAFKTEAKPFNVAIDEVIELSTGGDAHKSNLRKSAGYFEAYIKTQFPDARPWFHEIDVTHVIGFVKHLQGNNVTNKTIRHYTLPVLMASRHFVSVDPARYNKIDLNMRKYLPLGEKTQKVWTLPQALKIEALCRQSESAYVMPLLMLGAFAGLNINEIQRLQKKDWNSRAGMLTIRQAKTEHRPRVIPVVDRVRQWCDGAFRTLEGPDSWLIVTESGNPVPETDYSTMARAMRRRIIEPAVKMWGPSYKIPPSDCRETFARLMVAANVDADARRAYMGHAGADEHSKKYARFKEHPRLLKQHVVEKLTAKFKELGHKEVTYSRPARIIGL